MSSTELNMHCAEAADLFRSSLESELDAGSKVALQQHLNLCASCKKAFDLQSRMFSLLNKTYGDKRISVGFENAANRRLTSLRDTPTGAHSLIINQPLNKEREMGQGEEQVIENLEKIEEPVALAGAGLGAAPWWAVSVLLHVLIIALASLVSMAVNLPDSGDTVIMITDLSARPEVVAEVEKPKTQDTSALESKRDTPPTDLTSKEASDIVVPADILAKAELGNHFETINLDRPDTQSALGNHDAHMFHSEKGNDEPEGGGGVGGTGLDELIGMGGLSSKGSGGGWGGGNGTGIGVGTGSGSGSFGQRGGGGRRWMVKKHGGSKATESAVDLALQWLAYHQEPDGHWDSMKYEAIRKCDTFCTSVALLAFLGAGHTEKVGPYKDNVQRAVAWLKSVQQPNGAIINLQVKEDRMAYQVAASTMAISEAAGMSKIKETCEAAQKAVNYCVDIHQEGEGSEKLGWRYHPKEKGDLSVTGWFVLALKSAKVAGLHVDQAAFEGAIKFLDSVELKIDDKTVDTAYGPVSEFSYVKGRVPGPRTTAIGCVCRLFLGWKPEVMQSSIEHFVKKYGLPNEWGAKTDMYYWYYGTLCVFQGGGEVWKQWNEAMKKSLVENQRKDGESTGSWDPVGGPWDKAWGRVGQTAIGALCLEVYYRYLQLEPGK